MAPAKGILPKRERGVAVSLRQYPRASDKSASKTGMVTSRPLSGLIRYLAMVGRVVHGFDSSAYGVCGNAGPVRSTVRHVPINVVDAIPTNVRLTSRGATIVRIGPKLSGDGVADGGASMGYGPEFGREKKRPNWRRTLAA